MKTILETYEHTIIVEKSKFIAIAFPIASSDIFNERLINIKKLHKKAKHVVYAYRVGDLYKSNDDGEPKGTAGRPILEVLLKKDLNNLAVIVVRYFGGTLLGAGRLLRTYVQAASSVLDDASYKEI